MEQELPTVTQKLLTTSECLLASLGSLSSSTGKVSPVGGSQQSEFLPTNSEPSFCSLAIMMQLQNTRWAAVANIKFCFQCSLDKWLSW